MDATIRRRYLRCDIALPVRFVWDGEERSCLTTTLGEGGLYAQSMVPPPRGALIQVEFDMPTGPAIRATGEIRHSLPNSYGSLPAGFGVQFLDLAESDRQRILALVHDQER